ncbi:MAG: hypothetical protein Q8930_10130 [Bacillota bacterium]|nr:hypothetical protein [Bacillota bacterium]
MKKQLIVISLISSLLLMGCSSKGLAANSPSAKGNTSVTAASGGQASQESGTTVSTIEKKRADVKTDFKPVQSNSVPKLTQQQKSQLDSKLNPTLKSIDSTLKSLQDAPDINLNSVGN